MPDSQPITELAKLLVVFVQEIGNQYPLAFQHVDVNKAIRQANSVENEKF